MIRPPPADVQSTLFERPRVGHISSPFAPHLSPLVLGIAAAHVLVQLAVAGRYGYHRDELYFLACARRLAWGYVDQPPLTPALAWLTTELFGESLVGLRLFPALVGGVVVMVAALIARELGGGRFAQRFAALAVAISTLYLIVHHLFGPTSFDQLAWALAALILARLFRTGDRRLWLLVGLVAGIGLLNKHTVLFFGFGLVVGLLLTEHRRELLSPWIWAGGALALLIWSPNLLWQAQNGWPTLEMMRSLNTRNSGLAEGLSFAPFQLIIVTPLLAPVWIAGLWWLLRGEAGRPFRPFGWAYVALLILLPMIGGKPYYIGPLYTILLPAGAIVVERHLRPAWRRPLVAVVALGALVCLPIALPVLPAAALPTVPVYRVNKELTETIGWPELVDALAGVYEALPPAERATAAIYTANYGEAGAVELLGHGRGLPPVVSGHNNYWLWGPGSAPSGTAIAIGFRRREQLDALFGEVTLVARIASPHGIENEEHGAPIWLARQPRGSWSELWPGLKRYN